MALFPPPPSRPRFPVQLDSLGATKKIAARAGVPGLAALNGLKKTPFVAGYGSGLVPPAQSLAPPDFRSVRLRMVQRLAAQGTTDARVLQAMATVERHTFVDSALAVQAYEDTSLPIGWGQTISKPNVVARMLELLLQPLGNQPGHTPIAGRVLEIGTGCGYQAALLALLFCHVTSVERIAGLHAKAGQMLRSLSSASSPYCCGLQLLHADGLAGHAPGAPYLGIIAAAGGNAIPSAWTDQLAMGGRLVAPLVDSNRNPVLQMLVAIDKTPQGLQKTVLEAVHFVPLKSGVQ